MKWLISLILSIFALNTSPNEKLLSPTTTGIPEPYVINHAVLPPNAAFLLINNLENKLKFFDLVNQNNCQFAVNGGFYTEDFKPLGWMVIDKNRISKVKTSLLFNGFIVSDTKTLKISKVILDTSPEYGHQTGPLLLWDGKPLILSMERDKQARRMVIAKDHNESSYLISVSDSQTGLSGPTLTELPKVIEKQSIEKGWDLISAINLDGGGASALYTSDTKIDESSLVGSVWCVKN